MSGISNSDNLKIAGENSSGSTFYLNGTAQTSNAGTSITTNFTSTEFNIGRNSSQSTQYQPII